MEIKGNPITWFRMSFTDLELERFMTKILANQFIMGMWIWHQSGTSEKIILTIFDYADLDEHEEHKILKNSFTEPPF